jgi:hypothetical protein
LKNCLLILGKSAFSAMKMPQLAIALVLLAAFPLHAQNFSVSNDVSNYGYLDQHSLDNINSNNFVGNEACVPTSSVNAFTYLQNVYGSIFGTNLSGSTYADWMNTDQTLINLYGTQSGSGTTPQNFANGIQSYIAGAGFFHEISINSMYSSAYAPITNSFNSNSVLSLSFIEKALSDKAALLVSIDYTNGGGGHELLVNGLSWDTTSQTGILYFVDPLDPSQGYNGTNVLGPTLQTKSDSFSIDANGQFLLSYSQLHGDNLTNSFPNPATDTNTATAYVRGGLSLTVVPEPSTYALFGLGALALGIAARRRVS